MVFQGASVGLMVSVQVAVVGCGHGELVKIYETLEHIETTQGFKVELLLICGDFQVN